MLLRSWNNWLRSDFCEKLREKNLQKTDQLSKEHVEHGIYKFSRKSGTADSTNERKTEVNVMLLDVLRERQNDKATCKLTSNEYVTMRHFHVRLCTASCTVLTRVNVAHTMNSPNLANEYSGQKLMSQVFRLLSQPLYSQLLKYERNSRIDALRNWMYSDFQIWATWYLKSFSDSFF